MSMSIKQQYVTKSDCYNTQKTITPKGIMVHSTATPGVNAQSFFTRWNQPGKTVCPHAVLDDKEILQILPWNHRSWHCGRIGNDTHISFEICEPKGITYNANATKMVSYEPDSAENKAYFEAIWKNAVELCVFLCKEYGLTEKDICDHAEGYQLGIASNHGDTKVWFSQHNKTMDDFRADVKAALTETAGSTDGVLYKVQCGAFSKKENAEAMQVKLTDAGFESVIVEIQQTVSTDDYKTLYESLKKDYNNLINDVKAIIEKYE